MAIIETETDASLDFDETFYLQRYPDVARTVGSGGWRSGLEHYLLHGRHEGRLAKAPSNKTLDLTALREESINHQDAGFLAPTALSVTPACPMRAAMIGSCLLRAWDLKAVAKDLLEVDLYVVNFLATLPEKTADDTAEYDFSVIQIPLRSVVNDVLWRLRFSDLASHEKIFEDSCARLEAQLRNWMVWNIKFGLLTFVCNFFVPQGNPMGRLLPRYDLRNPQFFVEKLNIQLEALVREYKSAYLFDIDRISASYGRRFVQDDVVSFFSHNSFLGNDRPLLERIEPVANMSEYYPIKWGETVRPAIWAELCAMLKTVRQIDGVKLVVVDLDDTIWNGVSGDISDIDPSAMTEGWPLGFVEALMYLKKRGVLLGIISRNEDARIRQIFPAIWGKKLLLEDFASVKINWRPKAENMAEILAAVNLLPRNVVFIDDNPVERGAMQSAFPQMRILGRHLHWLRRILLWSSETEVVGITEESDQRSEMVKRQVERETLRTSMSRIEFLASAAPSVEIFKIAEIEHTRFPRVLELLNKTNQFNTTGRRWKAEELREFLGSGGQILAFTVVDSFTSYGLTGVVLIKKARIIQWVMSCRVLGYEIEQAVMHAIVSAMKQDHKLISATLINTEFNFPCRSLFSSTGFELRGDDWVLLTATNICKPEHVKVKMTL